MPTKRQDALRIAAEAAVDFRTAEKAIEKGPKAVRGQAGERIAAAMDRLGIKART